MTEDAGTAPGGAARQEAERLVAAGLAAVSAVAERIGAPVRARGGAAAAGYDALGDVLFGPADHRRHRVANDSAECCRCPLCRVIAAAREPSPVFAERLATGVGDLADGAARLLRQVTAPPGRPAPGGDGRSAAGGSAHPAPSASSVPSAADRTAPAAPAVDAWAAATDPPSAGGATR